MFRKPRFHPINRKRIPEAPPLLQRANEIFANGNYEEAGKLFEQLAYGAQTRNMAQDAHLFLRAGHCYILAGKYDIGLNDTEQGIKILLGRGKIGVARHAAERITTILKNRNLEKEAEDLLRMLPAKNLPNDHSTQVEILAALPTTCPSCGGSIHSNEIDWIDSFTAECAYCGSAIRTNK